MDAAGQPPAPQFAPPRKRFRPRFSLRSLLIFIFMVAIPCAWISNRLAEKRAERQAILAIETIGGTVKHIYDMRCPCRPPGPAWMRKVLGDDFFCDVLLVDFDGATVTETDLRLLDCFRHLRSLSFYRSASIGDDAMQHLTGLSELENLDLSNTAVTDVGLDALPKFQRLRYICLAKTKVTDEGLDKLREALPQCKISIICDDPEADMLPIAAGE